jgi:hypothetical protein
MIWYIVIDLWNLKKFTWNLIVRKIALYIFVLFVGYTPTILFEYTVWMKRLLPWLPTHAIRDSESAWQLSELLVSAYGVGEPLSC